MKRRNICTPVAQAVQQAVVEQLQAAIDVYLASAHALMMATRDHYRHELAAPGLIIPHLCDAAADRITAAADEIEAALEKLGSKVRGGEM